MVLDPNAQAYTDDEIVGKVNTATATITRSGFTDSDKITEGSTNKYDTGAPPATLEDLSDGATRKAMSDTEKTKLTGIEDDAKDDQTGLEVRDLIVALADLDRKLVITNPQSGEFTVVSVQRKADGKLGTKYDDVAV